MSLESDLVAALTAMCPRVFPDFAPVGTAMPYVTWQQIGGEPLTCLDGSLPDKRNAEVQVNVWALSRLEANTLLLQIEAALCASTAFAATPSSALRSSFTEDEGRRGAEQDFSIWATR